MPALLICPIFHEDSTNRAMKIRSIFRGRRNKFIIGISGSVAWVFAACIFLRIHRPKDVNAYFEMARECHPVWRQFAFRQVGAGDSLVALLKRYPPKRREEFGRYGIYTFHPWESNTIPFTGLTVTSRDGKLLSAGAWSCTWQRSEEHTSELQSRRELVC